MLSLLSISMIISPISYITVDKCEEEEKEEGNWKREANGKERANKTARVKWAERKARGKWQIM